MVKPTELQGRGNKNLDRGSNLKNNYLRIFNLGGKSLFFFFLLFLISSVWPTKLNSGIIAKPAEKEIMKKINMPSKESISELNIKLFTEVEKYIKNNSRGSKLKASKLIEECSEQKFDIILALSQAHIESHFGTKGMAAKTNSVFNVGTFDDGTILYRYKDPNLSIAPYIYLVKRRYLVNNITSYDLLKPRKFVNYKGLRYASHIRYEIMVKGVYDNIKKYTPIDSLWKSYLSEDVINAQKIYEYKECLSALIDSYSI